MARISLAFSAWCNGRLKLKHITVRLDKLPTNTDTAVGKQRKGTSVIGTVFWQCIEWLILRDWCGFVCATFYLFVAQSSWRFEGRCRPQTAERPGLANLWWFQGAATDAAEAALVMWVSGGADHAHWFTICVLHWTRQKEAKQILENYCACVVKHESAVCHFLVFTPGNCVGFTFGTVLNLCIRVSVSVLTFEMVLAGLPPLVKGWRCSSHSCNSWALLQNTVMRSIMLPAANKTTRNKWRAAFLHRCYIQRLHRLMMGMNVLRTMRKVKWLSEALRRTADLQSRQGREKDPDCQSQVGSSGTAQEPPMLRPAMNRELLYRHGLKGCQPRKETAAWKNRRFFLGSDYNFHCYPHEHAKCLLDQSFTVWWENNCIIRPQW